MTSPPSAVAEDTTVYYDNSESKWENVYVSWVNPQTNENMVKEIFDEDGDGIYEAAIYGKTPSFSFGPEADVTKMVPWFTEAVAGETYKYVPEVSYTVTFNANKGTGTMEAQTVSGTAVLNKNAFTYVNHEFTGWNTMANGYGTAYVDGAEVTLTADITLYAQWKDTYYSVISEKNWDIAPGITETELVLNNAAGNQRQVLHIMEADMTNPYTKVTTSYTNMDTSNYAVSNMLVQANWVRDNWGWNVVGAMNSCLSWYNSAAYAQDPSRVNEPLGFMMIDSEVYFDHSVGFPTVLVIHKETNAEGEPRPAEIPKVQMRTVNNSGDLNGWEDQVIPVSSGFIVENGINKNSPGHTGGAPRSVVGIKPDGTVVIMMNDGRQAPYSIGMNMYELAEVMISLGCSYAVNCDGGGSSTFLSQRPGTTGLAVNCSPSDGALRENTSGVLIISTAPADGAFNKAYISSEYDYYVPYAEVTLDAAGLDFSGSPAEIPEDVSWTLSDTSFGTVADGVFTSTGKTGTVAVQMIYNGEVVGSKALTIVNPDTIAFAQDSTVIPYGKTISMDIRATYGVFDVGYTADSFDWTLSNENAGVREDLMFTATENTDISGVVVTATYKHAQMDALTLTITYGKGSEVVWNFEDGDVSNWMGQEQVRAWLAENEIPESGLFPGGNYSEDNSTRTFLASRENGGQVKNGNYALGLELDYRYSRFSEWSYTVLFNVEGQTVLRDVNNGMNATKLGMWVYIPEGLVVGSDLKGLAMQYQLYGGDSEESVAAFAGHLLTAAGKNLASLTDADIPEDRWVYFYIDLTSKNYVSLQNPEAQIWREPSFIRFYTQHYTPKNMIFYFDDMTLDYSDAVEDRDPPAISNLVIDVEGNNRRTFNATIADHVANNTSGLNYSSAKIYVDGVALSGVSASGNRISGDAVEIPCGVHTVTFEISDNMGNTAKKSQSFTVAGTAPVTLGGHNDLNNKPEYDSVYYVDINVADIAAIDSVSAVLDLNNAHLWETAGMTVAEGFTATSSVNKYANTVTVTVTRTNDCSLTGAQTLVSIPTRIYSWRDTSVYTADEIYATGLCPIVPYDAKVVKGSVTFAEGAYAGYAGVFGGSISVVTNLDDNKVAWHSHTVTELDDKAATCGEVGYTDRTYCHECGSVIAWGTSVPATGHTYAFAEDGVLKCTCGALFTGIHTDGKAYVDGVLLSDSWVEDSYFKDGVKLTGVQKVPAPDSTGEFYYDFGESGECAGQKKYSGMFQDGELYRYSYLGVLTSGWNMVDDAWHYFSPSTMAAVSGPMKINGIHYEFEENGKLTTGVWVNAFNGYRYYYGPNYYTHKWQLIDGEYYYFEDGLRVTGYRQVITFGLMYGWTWYYFDENGVLQGEADGLCDVDGTLYCFDNGKPVNELYYADGDYYYFNYYGAAETGKIAVGSNAYGLPNGYYHFGDDGKMIGSSENGEIVEIEGIRYYFVKGRPVAAGLVWIEDDLYFVDNDGKIAIGNYYVWKGNGILPENTYYFAEDGKMVGTNEEGAVVETEDGIYYYKNGRGTDAGLIQRDGYYYFAGTNGKLATGEAYVWNSNGHMREDTYWFGEDGAMLGIKLVDNQVVVGQMVDVDGTIYYYENGKPVAAGMLESEGHYYFAGLNGQIATGETYVWQGNGIVTNGDYYFGADGKLLGVQIVEGEEILGEISEINGILYYFNRGKAKTAGLINIGGYYYFAGLEGKIATGETYVWQGNGLLRENTYYFAEDGKLIGMKQVEDEVISGEIISSNGSRYYYVDGKPEPAGLIMHDGYYYFAGLGGKLATGMAYAWRTNGLVREDNYYFDQSGKMLGVKVVDGQNIYGQIVTLDGKSYYYKNGKPEPGGLVLVDDRYYFAGLGGEIATGEAYVWRGNGILREDTYYFNTAGQMLGIYMINGEMTSGEMVDGYYYEDGKPEPAGLIEYDGHYYFADVGGKIATGEKYVWRTNGLMAQDTYCFSAEGKMLGIKVVENELVSGDIVETEDGLYYYKNGKANAAGLVVVDGYYYFAGVNGKLAIGEAYVWKGNGILPENTYLFGENGAMLGIKVVDGNVISGEIVETNGALYYIKAGKGQSVGLLLIDGYYYFAGANGQLVTNKDFYVWEANGLLVEQIYTFDAQGRIVA